MLQTGNGTGNIWYLIAAVGALATAIAALAKYVQSQTTHNQQFTARQLDANREFFVQQLEATSKHLDAERNARTEELKAFISQLDSLTRQNREAHQREMQQVLERQAESDRILARQTEILADLRRIKRT